MTIKEQAVINLRDTKNILDELGILFWLDFGTLLGAYRDKDFCENDEDDIDLSTWDINIDKKQIIIDKMVKIGFNLYMEWETEISMKRGGQKVDIFFYKKEGDKAIIPLYSQNTKNIVAPAHFYEELGDISFYGMDFKCPLDIDNYLKAQYGDWETKINRKNFDYSNPEHHKLLV